MSSDMELKSESLVREQLEAYNARDVEAFLRPFDEKVLATKLLTGEVLYAGKDAMRPIFTKFFASSPKLHCKIVKRTIMGRVVVDEELIDGHVAGDGVRALAIYETNGEKITRIWFARPNE